MGENVLNVECVLVADVRRAEWALDVECDYLIEGCRRDGQYGALGLLLVQITIVLLARDALVHVVGDVALPSWPVVDFIYDTTSASNTLVACLGD